MSRWLVDPTRLKSLARAAHLNGFATHHVESAKRTAHESALGSSIHIFNLPGVEAYNQLVRSAKKLIPVSAWDGLIEESVPSFQAPTSRAF